MANILLTGIYPGSDLDAIDVILEFVASRQSDGDYNTEFEWNWREELALGARGKVGDMKLQLSPKSHGGQPTLPDGADTLIDLQLKLIFNGPAIWDDEMFSTEYFETITAFHGPLDGICLVMKDWLPDGDYRLSRWLEWVRFYEQILAPTTNNEMDIYVLFLYKSEAYEDHIETISATATTCGIRCFVVGEGDGMFTSGKSAINSECLSRWLMTLAVDMDMKEIPSVPGTSTTFEEIITPGREELDPDDPLAGLDLAAQGFNMELEDDDEFREPVLADLDDDDPLAGLDMAGFKIEYEDDDDDDDDWYGPTPIPTSTKLKGLDAANKKDDIEPPDTAEEKLRENLDSSDPLHIQPGMLSKKKPMRLGKAHQFLISTILDLIATFRIEAEGLESTSASINYSLKHMEEHLKGLIEDRDSSQKRYDSLFQSTRLVSGHVVSRRHNFRLLDPSPRKFSFDEQVDFPIKEVKDIEISGKKDPKIWGSHPQNPHRFIGKVKNDVFRSAKCEFHLLGYEKDVLAKTIKDLDNKIKDLNESIKSCSDKRDALKQELTDTDAEISKVEVRLWSCDLDIAALNHPASLVWDMVNMKRYLKEHDIYGIVQEYKLCSYAKSSFIASTRRN
ncbi:hypothetical protein AA313_de0208240 [Arthrobotrys entomopaga]|nr:hypothetical protein AA313_de0208240 [Arthrobotrys entomopaga]